MKRRAVIARSLAGLALSLLACAAQANVFGDHDPRRLVGRDDEPIVEIVSEFRPTDPDSGAVAEILRRGGPLSGTGSGVFVSPCYVLTANHVVFNQDNDVDPRAAAGFKVTVRVGSARTPVAGTVVRYGARTRDGQGDWALVRLARDATGKCPGARFGWMTQTVVALPSLLPPNVKVGFVGLARDIEDPTLTAVHDGCHVYAQDETYGVFYSNCATRSRSSGAAITLAAGRCHVPHLIGLVIKDLTPEPGLLPQFDLRHSTVAVSIAQPFAVTEVARDVQRDRLGKRNPFAERYRKPCGGAD